MGMCSGTAPPTRLAAFTSGVSLHVLVAALRRCAFCFPGSTSNDDVQTEPANVLDAPLSRGASALPLR